MKRHSEDCQFLYKKLLHSLDNNEYMLYNSLLKQTVDCDYLNNFQSLRDDINNMDDVKNIDDSKMVQKIQYNVFHHSLYHKDRLKQALDVKNKMSYKYSIFKCELYRVFNNIFS